MTNPTTRMPGGGSSRFLRQLDILPPEKLTFPVTVVGAGAIGSAAVVTLAKMGCSNITVWDDDELEEKNVPNQMCLVREVGESKVQALSDLTCELAEIEIVTKPKRYQGQPLSGVVIAATDSMDSRKTIWKTCRYSARVKLLIDARMGAEFARLYSICPTNPTDVTFYEANLYDNAEPLPCSARAIIYCPTIIAGLIALLVKKHALAEPFPREILFDLPSFRLTTSP